MEVILGCEIQNCSKSFNSSRFIAIICEMFMEVGDSLNLMEVEKIGAK